MLSELKRISDQVKFMQNGPAWHGKSLAETLEGMHFQDAARSPLPGMHSVWELLLHIMAWRSYVIEMLKGNDVFTLKINSEQDWPPIPAATSENWESCLDQLHKSSQNLRNLLSEQADTLLEQSVPQKPYSFYILLQGVVQHDAYHCGQIALTRKILELS